jgi:hypothetical protein
MRYPEFSLLVEEANAREITVSFAKILKIMIYRFNGCATS